MSENNHIAFTSGVLSPNTHGHFVKNIGNHARVAGIPENYIYESAIGKLSPNEEKWVKGFHKNIKKKLYGLVYMGDFPDHPIERINIITGVFVRNFVDARVRMLTDVLDQLKTSDFPSCKVLSIPNFFSKGAEAGKILYEADTSRLLGMLMRRGNEGLTTILYIENQEAFKKSFGNSFFQYLQNYTIMESEDVVIPD